MSGKWGLGKSLFKCFPAEHWRKKIAEIPSYVFPQENDSQKATSLMPDA